MKIHLYFIAALALLNACGNEEKKEELVKEVSAKSKNETDPQNALNFINGWV